MRKDTWVVQLWSIVFNLVIFLHQRRYLAIFFLVVCTSTSESGETSEQKRGSRKTLILWSRHCAHYLSQTLWRVFDFPSQKHILVIWFPFSTRNIFSVSQIFKSFLEAQRPNPTEMCDLRYAYTSHVQKSFFSTNIRFSSRQIPGSVLNLSFCSNSKCPQFHPWVEVSPCWYINRRGFGTRWNGAWAFDHYSGLFTLGGQVQVPPTLPPNAVLSRSSRRN